MEQILSLLGFRSKTKNPLLAPTLLIWDWLVFFACWQIFFTAVSVKGLWAGVLATQVLFIIFYCFDLFQPDPSIVGTRLILRSVFAVLVGLVASVIATELLWPTLISLNVKTWRTVFTLALLKSFGLIAVATAVSRFFAMKWVQMREFAASWLVIGKTDKIRQFIDDVERSKSKARFCYLSEEAFEYSGKAIGSWSNLSKTITDPEDWNGIVLAYQPDLSREIVDSLLQQRIFGVQIYDFNDYYEKHWQKIPVYHLQSGWFVLASGFLLLQHPLGLRLKRLVDLTLSALLLLVSLPVLLFVMILIKIDSRGPVFYKQNRTGEDGRIFKVMKFRSMRTDAEKNGAQWAQKNDSRITRVGKILRLTRIDEIPQIWNVFRGDMSFIGPRPERPEFNEKLREVIPFYDMRHTIKPGITGWAQVKYPYGASTEDAREKLQYDLYYIKNFSPFLDIAILMKTVRVVLFGKGR